MLARRGWQVLVVPYLEWRGLSGAQQKGAYIGERLLQLQPRQLHPLEQQPWQQQPQQLQSRQLQLQQQKPQQQTTVTRGMLQPLVGGKGSTPEQQMMASEAGITQGPAGKHACLSHGFSYTPSHILSYCCSGGVTKRCSAVEHA